MNNDDGALHLDLTISDKQFQGAMEENLRRVKGFSNATAAEGMKIEKAFEQLARKIATSKELIAATEVDVKKMESMLKNIAPGAAKADLLGELRAAKKALQEENAALADLEAQADAAGAAHIALRTQIRQMTEELVRMEAAGMRGTQEYDDLQSSLGKLTQQMNHAQKQANILANDQVGLRGLIQGLSGVAGMAAAAQGAIALFAGENDNLVKIQTKVQSLMSLTIGLQQTQQMLNKNEAFMLGVVTKAKNGLAAAELKLAAAFGISTAAARVLMATLTLGLSAAVTVAITAISRYVNKTQEARKAAQEFNKATAEAGYQSLAAFEKMRLEWNRLGDDMKAKNRFIKDNKDAFEDLGIQVRGTADAESIFIKNTEAFKAALMERAMALAAEEIAQEKYKEAILKELDAKSIPAKRGTEAQISAKAITTAGGEVIGTEVEFEEEFTRKRQKLEEAAKELRKTADELFTGSIEHRERFQKILDDLNLQSSKPLEDIVLLEQKIAEQEKLLTEAAEAGNIAEVKAIAERIKGLKAELELREQLINAIYAQMRANELVANTQSDAWQPAGLNIKVGAPSTGGKAAGARYNQTAVFDLGAESKKLAVMNQQLVNARNQEAIKKKLKKVDDEMKEITEDELERRKEIAQAVSETVAILERGGLVSSEMASQLQGMIGVAGSLATGDYIGAIVNGVAMFVDAISQILDASDGFEKRLERMNILLEKQARLVELSQREGGGKEAREAELDALRLQVKLYEEQVAKAEKRLQNAYKWNLTGTKREKDLKEVQAAAEKARIALEDAEQAYKDFLTGGVTQNTIADTITAGLMEGKRSLEDFAQDMNNILTQAVTNAISAKILGPAIDELTDYLAEAMKDGVLSPEEAERYKTMFGQIAAEGAKLADASSAALRSVQDPDKTLSGAIKGITEETAGVLAGQVNAMRINQVEGTLIMRQQLIHLAEIAANTRYNKHLEKLGSIDSKLDALKSDPLRATGLNI